ncbi:hypothetical protein [Streptomyces sp. NPDC102462]|uniref:hypothetical protein n=1 Tax=Streptomyces sp. NPDC102462 TaxID=3366178 RepID=UPI0038287FEE
MASADRFVSVHRDPHSEEVLVRGGTPEAHSIIQRSGFVPVVRLHETYHRTPAGLTGDRENRMATDAVAQLRSAGYHVDCDEPFDTNSQTVRHPALGGSVAHLAERLREATTTGEAADVLTELTAPHDGILAGLDETLAALADFFDGLGNPADPHIARRLRYLADEYVRIVRTDLAHTRGQLADRHASHPGRRDWAQEVHDKEHERSAVCAGPPPPGALPSPASPPVTAGPRR